MSELKEVSSRPKRQPPVVARLNPAEHAALLSVDFTAGYLGVSEKTVLRLIETGEIKSLIIRRRRLITRQSLDELIERGSSRKPRVA